MKPLFYRAAVFFSIFFSSAIPNAAVVETVQGTVLILDKEGDAGKPAEAGLKIAENEIIQTGERSLCVVKIDEDNSFRIKQNAQVKMEKLLSESEKLDGKVVREVRLNLIEGEVAVKLRKLPEGSEFNVTGPVAIAGASGTAFTVAVDRTSRKTAVSVLDHQVRMRSIQDEDKSLTLGKFQRAEASPWETTLLREDGRGVLSEKILGKEFVRAAGEDIRIRAAGRGSNPDEAKLRSLHQLSKMVLALQVDSETTVEKAMSADETLTQKVYSEIAGARILGTAEMPDGTVEVQSEIAHERLTQALGRPIYGMAQSVIPVTMAEYAKKFGALARVTTQRAAQVEGYRNLAEAIYGTVLRSGTTVEDFAVKDDTVRTHVQGLVKGAVVVETMYFSDGSIIVTMELRGDLIPQQLSAATGDVFGENYLSGPQLLEFANYEVYRELEQ